MAARAPKADEPLTAAPERVRGYYTTPLGKFRSVTTILDGGYPKPALVHWSAREVAACAIENLPYLAKLRGRAAREEAFEWLRRAAERKKEGAADLGSAIHHHAEARVLGKPMPEPTDEQAPFIEAFDHFLDDWKPEFEATELTVAHPGHEWAGTGDGWLRFPRHGDALAMIDYKSGRKPYGEAGMQLAAYRRATVGWLKNGTEVEPPATDRAYVVHLRPDKYPDGYAVIPVDTGDEMYAQFRTVQAVDAGRRLVDKALGDPEQNPLPDTQEVA